MTSISVKKQIFSDSMKYILSHYVAQFFGFIISIAMKRFLGPTMVGVWNIVLLISAYCSFAGLGSSEVAFRDIPFLKGARQFEKAERLKNEVFTLTSLAAFFSAVMVIAYALFKRESLDHYLFIAMFYTAVWVIVQRIYEYYTTLLRANKEFTVISKVTIWAAFLNLVLTFALVRPFGLYGLFVASFVNTLFAFWFVKKRVPYHFQWMLSRTGFLGILKIGFPLLLLGLCAQTVSSIDRIMIAAYLGVTELGNYSIALMAGAYLLGMPNMFCVALYPRLQEKYGECPTAENIKNYFLNPIKVISVVIGVIIGMTALCVPSMVHILLPQFVPGIPAMKIFVWSTFFFATGQHAYTFLVTLNKQLHAIPIALLGMLAIGGFDFMLIRSGFGIFGVAWGVVLGSIIYNLTLILYANLQFANFRESLSLLKYMFFVFLYFLLLTTGLSSWGADTSIFTAFIRCVCFLLFAAPVLWVMEKKTGSLTLAFSVLKDKFQRRTVAPMNEQKFD